MFPIRDDNPTFHASFATFTIIGLNVVAWVLFQGWGSNPTMAKSIFQFGLIPGEFLGYLQPGAQIPLGHGLAYSVGDHPNWLSPLTSMFMHGGWLHLIINMWFLSIFGDNVEDAMGGTRFFIFYLICGLGAVAVHLFSDPGSYMPMVGASGAIGGVMGGYALLYPKAPVHLIVFLGFFFFRVIVPAYLMLGYWFLLQLLSAAPTVGKAGGGVAFWAHVGGFATGVVLVKLFCRTERLAVIYKKKKPLAGGL